MMAGLRSARQLGRHWKLTAIATVSLSAALALGVLGLSVSNTFLLLPPAAPDPDRLVMIYDRAPGKAIDQISYPDYEYFRQNSRAFTDLAAAPNSISLNVDFNFEGRDVRVLLRPVSDNYFAVLGIRPALGRFFNPGEDRTDAHLAVMTYSCWKRLGSDPNIVGKTLSGNTIVGVAPKEFKGGFYGAEGDLFTSLAHSETSRDWFTQRTARRLFLIGRLQPGVSRQQAQAQMFALSGQLASAYPADDKDRTALVTRATLLPPDGIAPAEMLTGILMTLIVLVLLIACANVANLLLAIAVGRRQEAAIKLALGARRVRLVREFLAESALLCAVSGALGYGIAEFVITRYSNLTMVFPGLGAFPFSLNLRLDSTVAAFTLALVLMATLATGLAPALYASAPALAQVLAGELAVGGTRKGARRNALVIVQVAVCTVVLVGLGLCERNLYNLRHADMGFAARNLVADTVYLDAEGYARARGQQFYGTLRDTVSALPGVESVALTWDLPLFGSSEAVVQFPDGQKKTPVARTVVDSGYFATLRLPILAGRGFDSSDRENSPPVAVINRKMAEMFFPGQDPLGKTIVAENPRQVLTVIGVAADGKYENLDEAPRPFMYYALSQNYRGSISVLARTRGDPALWVDPMAKALRGLGLKIMVQPITLDSWLNLSLFVERITAGAVAILSALGLLLAVIGLSGAISYAVSERTKELGIRVALGARPSQLTGMILRQTLWIAGAGVLLGTAMGIGATAVLRSRFYQVTAVEWVVLLPAAAAMLCISLVVAYFSARPWMTINPMDAVRHA